MSDKKPPAEERMALRTIAMPADTNPSGDIFGGWLLAQMDLAGGAAAIKRTRGRVATVQVEAMTFHRSVHVGDLVSIHSDMLREGRSSMKVGVEAWVTRQPSGERFKVTEAVFTFVAIGEDGKSRALP